MPITEHKIRLVVVDQQHVAMLDDATGRFVELTEARQRAALIFLGIGVASPPPQQPPLSFKDNIRHVARQPRPKLASELLMALVTAPKPVHLNNLINETIAPPGTVSNYLRFLRNLGYAEQR